VVIGVPAPYLSYVREMMNPNFAVAAQNCLDKSKGAFTGEICPVCRVVSLCVSSCRVASGSAAVVARDTTTPDPTVSTAPVTGHDQGLRCHLGHHRAL
jgi:hypothetical protein